MTDIPDPISDAIIAHWGERCANTMEGCPCCDAWAAYDRLRGPEAPVQEPVRRTAELTDADYDRAIGILIRSQRASTSYLQRKMSLGYNAAAKLIERAEDDGIVSCPNDVGKRDVLYRSVQEPCACEGFGCHKCDPVGHCPDCDQFRGLDHHLHCPANTVREPVAWYWTRGNDLELTLLRDGEYGKRLKAGGFTEVPLYAHPVQEPPSPGVTAGATGPVSDADFLRDAGMDGAKWAAGFKAIAERLGHHGMDEGWLIGWFCNAIMAGYDEAERRYQNATPAPVVPAERVTNRRAYQVGYAAGKAAALRSAPPVGARVTVQEAARVLLDAIGDYDRNRGHSDYDPSLPVGDALLSALAALLPAGEGE